MAIYLDLHPRDLELADGEAYRLVVYLIVSKESYESEDPELIKIKSAFEAGFLKCDGIQCHDVILCPDAEFSVRDVATTVQWDYTDYLSYTGREE